MYSKILILRFSKDRAQEPITCNLVKSFDLTFNILHAKIFPRREGLMVLELSGSKKDFKEGVKYLKSKGIGVQNASQEVERDENGCTHCGACTAVCPTGALYIRRPDMWVVFDQKKCSVCELCVPACPTRSMSVHPLNHSFFE